MAGLSSSIQLIVGLGNPGNQYANTRHNAGAWFVQTLAIHENSTFHQEAKFKGFYTSFHYQTTRRHLLIPTTFMNVSGQAIKSIAGFYHISPAQILVVHDDLDLPVGDTRLKYSGGHGGHNGLRDIIQQLNTHDFYRLRIGIGHPDNRNQVTDYVLGSPSRQEYTRITKSFSLVFAILPYLFTGEPEKAMQQLHTKS